MYKKILKSSIIKFLYPKVYKKSSIKSWIGIKNDKIEVPAMIGTNTVIYNNVKIGKYTSIRNNVLIDGNTLSIGRYCSIANDVSIGVGNHPIDKISTSDCFYYPQWGLTAQDIRENINSKKTIIGNDIWIGTKSVVLSGVNIGNGVVIGSGSIVTKDIPDYAIVGGVPAQIIKFRFNKVIIEELLKLQWWNIDENLLLEAWKKNNIEESIKFLKVIKHVNQRR